MQTSNNNSQQQYKVRINKAIRVPQVRLVLADGSNAGIINTYEALKLAQDQGLDLIEINPKSSPPVCKLADYGKLRYEEKKKIQAAKKNQQIQELKELTFRPNTDFNDLAHKLEQAKNFLEEGHRVKLTIRFKGREIVHPEVAKEKIDWMIQELENTILPNPLVSMEGKFMSTIVAPIKK